MDNGILQVFQGYRVQFNNARGRTKAAFDIIRRFL